MATWPTGWQRETLRASGIPVTQFALDVLTTWQQSTPTEPWTNNPLGMPASGSGYPKALNTQYAAFPTMAAFRNALKRFLKTGKGRNVLDALLSGQSFSDAWREIHALAWPANKTESEHPAKLMDKVVAAYTSKTQHKTRDIPTTSGATHAPPDVHDAMHRQARLLTHAANTFGSAGDAIAYIMRGMNPSG